MNYSIFVKNRQTSSYRENPLTLNVLLIILAKVIQILANTANCSCLTHIFTTTFKETNIFCHQNIFPKNGPFLYMFQKSFAFCVINARKPRHLLIVTIFCQDFCKTLGNFSIFYENAKTKSFVSTLFHAHNFLSVTWSLQDLYKLEYIKKTSWSP
jgi:hypothetical protein